MRCTVKIPGNISPAKESAGVGFEPTNPYGTRTLLEDFAKKK